MCLQKTIRYYLQNVIGFDIQIVSYCCITERFFATFVRHLTESD